MNETSGAGGNCGGAIVERVPQGCLWRTSRLGYLTACATGDLLAAQSAPFHAVFREILESQVRRLPRADVALLLKRVGFRFLEDKSRPRDVVTFLEQLADIVERPARALEGYDFGEDSMMRDMRRLFQREPWTALAARPPPESVFFSRAVVGLIQILRLLRSRACFHDVLAEIVARAAAAAAP
jgi:hypothetical protein